MEHSYTYFLCTGVKVSLTYIPRSVAIEMQIMITFNFSSSCQIALKKLYQFILPLATYKVLITPCPWHCQTSNGWI